MEERDEKEVRGDGARARVRRRGARPHGNRLGEAREGPLQGGLHLPGPHNDGGWSQAHERGRLAVQKALGSKVETTYKENVFSNAQVPQIVAGLAREGYDMIFGCSFGMFENGVNGLLYKKYPDILFEQATGLQIKKNQSEYFGAGEDTIYLSGMAAGAASKKGLIGYIVPFGIPEVVRHINAFALGAQATNPKAKVKLLWTISWFCRRRRLRLPRTSSQRESTSSARTSTVPRPVWSPSRRGFRRRLRLRRPQDGSEAVADGGDVQLGSVLREARQGRDQWNVEIRVLYYGSIKDELLVGGWETGGQGHGGDDEEGGHRPAEAIVSGKNASQARWSIRRARSRCPRGRRSRLFSGSLLDAVARKGCRRQDLVGPATRLAGGS